MGLFDRIKNAFIADKPDEEEKKAAEQTDEKTAPTDSDSEVSEESSETSTPTELEQSEAAETTQTADKTDEVVAAQPAEPTASDHLSESPNEAGSTTPTVPDKAATESSLVDQTEHEKPTPVEAPSVQTTVEPTTKSEIPEPVAEAEVPEPTAPVAQPSMSELDQATADHLAPTENKMAETSAPTVPDLEIESDKLAQTPERTPITTPEASETKVATEESIETPTEADTPVAPVDLIDTPADEITPEVEPTTSTDLATDTDTSAVSEQPADESLQEKYDKGLEKTRKSFGERMNEFFARFRRVDEDFFEELEETLIGADVGFDMAMKLTDSLRQEVKLKNAKKPAQIQNIIIEKMVDIYEAEGVDENNSLNLQADGPTVFLFVGVNGTGKTTSIGKLANQYKQEGKKVLLAAADTFRAGAIDQLVVWGERSGVEVVRGNAGGDPAAVVYDAVAKAKSENYDILLIDTAGRLQNKVNLMNELEKIKRVIQREFPSAPHEVLLVVDATTGQNAMVQARQFKETTDVTGLVLTKLDGTAKGGIVLAIRNELHLPVKLVGLGEGINDLEPFDPNEFAVGLFKGLLKVE